MKKLIKIKKYRTIIFSVLLSVVIYYLISLFFEVFGYQLSNRNYLTWHNLVEISSIMISFSIFSITYYTYKKTKVFSSIVIGQAFLISSILDVFHILSFKGMPVFFVENLEPNRTILFWIISRLVVAFGMGLVVFLPDKKECQINGTYLTVLSIIFSGSIFYIVTYKSNYLPVMFNENGLTPIKILLEWLVIILLAITAIRLVLSYERFGQKITHLLCMAFIIQIFSEISFVLYDDVYDIKNFIGHFYKAISYFILFIAIFKAYVYKPYDELKEYITNLDKIIDDRTSEIRMYNAKLVNDLNYAKGIQKSLLPDKKKIINNTLFYSNYIPADNLSGDYFNYYKINNENVAFFISDVSGHGVSAAMLTVFLNQCIKSAIERSKLALKPSKILENIYNEYNQSNFDYDVYILVFFCIYNNKENKLYCSSAGLNVEPIFITKDGRLKHLSINGFPICKLKDIYKPKYVDYVIKITKKEKLFLYTDGLSELKNISDNVYTEERIIKLIEKYWKTSGDEFFDIITDDLLAFLANTNNIKDDVSYMLVEF